MTPADFPSGLDAAAGERLLSLVNEAKERQSEAVDAAIDGGMGHIPRLLRGPVKAVLFR